LVDGETQLCRRLPVLEAGPAVLVTGQHFHACGGARMDIIRIMTENFWTTLVLMLFIITIVSIVMGILLEFYKTRIRAAERAQELRNEELRLQLQLQGRKDVLDSSKNVSLPKEPSWAEQSQVSYEMGYQQRD
jgi:cell division protein FtsL